MSTTANTPSVTPTKGKLRGQTTLAAEIDRWQALANKLASEINQLPGLQGQLTQFQTLLAGAVALRNQINTLQADTAAAFTQRNQIVLDGGSLFSRLSLALQSVHGPTSPRLKEFGLKPRRPAGRPGKSATPPPTVEVTTAHPPVPAAGT
jgi:hypothetical protein